MYATVSKSFDFDAAHQLLVFGEGHKCARLHGHTWQVEVTVAGAVNPLTGVVLDFYHIQNAWKPLHELLDHRYLNEIEGLEIPSIENLAGWIWTRLLPSLSSPTKTYMMSKLLLREGFGGSCEFFGAL